MFLAEIFFSYKIENFQINYYKNRFQNHGFMLVLVFHSRTDKKDSNNNLIFMVIKC